MKQRQENNHIVDLLFVLGLFFVFTISALFLILIGSGVYKNTVDKMDRNFDTRTAFAYVTEKIRQSDISDSVSVEDFDGHQALVLKEVFDDVSYSTYLYEENGYLKELFAASDNTLTADAGQDILPVRGFQVTEKRDNLLQIQLTTESGDYTFYVSTHCNHTNR